MSQTTSQGSSPSTGRRPINASAVLDVLLPVVTVLFVAALLLPWSRECLTVVPLGDRGRFCTNIAGWHGLGGLAGLLAAALLLLWAVSAGRRLRRAGIGGGRDQMARTVVALAVLALTAAEVALDRHTLAFGAWIGLALAIGLVVLAFGLLASSGATVEDRSEGPGPRPR